jgi:MFS family permease
MMIPSFPGRMVAGVNSRLQSAFGGPARTTVVVLFACVLALESADLTTVGALGPQLQSSLHVSNTELGLLAAVSTLVGGIMTLPFGVLTDRVRRVNLLSVTVATWALAMVVSATSQSYEWLLLSRVGLGAVTAAAPPAIASLVGDFFGAGERGRIYGYILSGELLGSGFGFVVSGSVGSALSWRWGFAVLAAPAVVLAVALRRNLCEPARGGQARLRPGAQHIADAASDPPPPRQDQRPAPEAIEEDDSDLARQVVTAQGTEPDEQALLEEDPDRMSLWRVVVHVLRIPTFRWLIVASAVGYFFFAGLRTFAVVFVRGHFGLSQSGAIALLFAAGLGALVGVLISGRFADARIRRGHVTARITAGAVLYGLAAVFLAPAILSSNLVLAVPALLIGAACLAAPNPPLDASRLDIMPSRLWGRAEGVRTLLRQLAQTGAPLLFGVLADVLGGTNATRLSSGGTQRISAASAQGLEYAFALMLIPLLITCGLLLWVPRREYPADVAAAMESEDRFSGQSQEHITSRATSSPGRPSSTSPSRIASHICSGPPPAEPTTSANRANPSSSERPRRSINPSV